MVEAKNVTGKIAFAYIREQLARGRILSDWINHLPIDEGSVFAFVPSGISEDKLYAFKYGGIYSFDASHSVSGHREWVAIQNDVKPLLVDEIYKHLIADKRNCCLFEEPIWELSDNKIKAFGLDYVYLNTGQVYYIFNSGNLDNEKIEKAIKVSEDYVFLCVLSRVDLKAEVDFLHSNEITLEALEVVRQNAASFFIRAYDGEGYLMWVKNVE